MIDERTIVRTRALFGVRNKKGSIAKVKIINSLGEKREAVENDSRLFLQKEIIMVHGLMTLKKSPRRAKAAYISRFQ